MKKFLSVLVVAVMVAALIPVAVMADEEYVSPGNILVPYTTGDGITIDGVIEDGEWSVTNKITLDSSNLRSWFGGVYQGPIDYFYSWGDKGLYMAAIVSDDIIESGLNEDGSLNATRFQIALNPAGIIDEDYQGLFFSIGPVKGSDDCMLMRHNYEDSTSNGAILVDEDEGFEGKYTLLKDGDNVIGWNLECIIPWDFIATEDRYTDLDETDEIYLTNFNPKDDNQKRAFITATICYVQCNAPNAVFATGRTATDGAAGDFTVASYDITLFLLQSGETTRDTETEYFKLDEIETTADTAKEETTTEEVTTSATEDTATVDETTAATDGTAATDAATDTAATTTDGGKTTTKSNNTAVIIIIIVACVVVIAVVCAIIISKKKKK